MHGRPVRVLGVVLAAGLLLGLGSSVASAAGGSPPPVAMAQWRQAMSVLRVPGKGCFAGSYPMVRWHRTRCATAPHHPYGPRGLRTRAGLPAAGHVLRPRIAPTGAGHAPRPQVVGNGYDYTAVASGGPISSVTGSFDSITAGTTETGQQNGAGPQVPNTYSLQLNTIPFTSPTCAGQGPPFDCEGWQQFLYSTTANLAFMQYWLLNYNATCPSAAWTPIPATGTPVFCWTDSPAGPLPGASPTVQQLPSVTLTGSVSAGGNDTVTMTAPSGTATAVNSDGALGLAGNWTGAEFAILGDCCSTQANFSAGTTLPVRTTLHNGTTLAPTCILSGFTGETNNLNLTATPALVVQAAPTMLSTQTSTPGPAGCATASGSGDTHNTTFGPQKLNYDNQATGLFEDATTGSNFIVESQQISAAPTYPNAAMNQAIGVQAGKAKVAVCTAPTRLYVNSKRVNLADGGQLSLPGGGNVSLTSGTYLITDPAGDSVSAQPVTFSPDYINLSVGLGQWPEPVQGLYANAPNGGNALAYRNGTVLPAPFQFTSFYNMVNSWRVPLSRSLTAPCGDKVINGLPKQVFYANNLPARVARAAKAQCVAALVETAPWIGDCTIDVAVLGKAAVSAYQNVPAQVTWDQIAPKK